MKGIRSFTLLLSFVIVSAICQQAMATCTLTGSLTKQMSTNQAILTVTASGGSGQYEYAWSSNIPSNATTTTHYVENNGIYSVTVIDNSTGCSVVLADTVTGLPCSIADTITYTYLGNGRYLFTAHTTGAPNAIYAWSLHPSIWLVHGGDTISHVYPSGPQSVGVSIWDSVEHCSYYDSLNFIASAGPLSVTDIMGTPTISVAPNPFSEYTIVTVTGVELRNASLEIYNMVGQRVSVSAPIADGVFHLNRGELGAGVYLYHIRQGDSLLGSGKLVVE